jgi:hypothetical protein
MATCSFLLSQTVGLFLTYFLELQTRKYRHDVCMIITSDDVLQGSLMLVEYGEIFAALSLPLFEIHQPNELWVVLFSRYVIVFADSEFDCVVSKIGILI